MIGQICSIGITSLIRTFNSEHITSVTLNVQSEQINSFMKNSWLLFKLKMQNNLVLILGSSIKSKNILELQAFKQ